MLLNHYDLEWHMQAEASHRPAVAARSRAAALVTQSLPAAPRRVIVRLGRLILAWQT
ncbi:MAG TPA: hypothetical protein VFM49_03165 [Chloroflexia bacterium]|jgi:hypothetical protein|nr:hypothetical protein [Chloroflexia bacterium]